MAFQMDNLIGLPGIRRMDRVLNAWIVELYGVKKGLDERIEEDMLQWRGWRMVGLPREYAGSCSVGRLWKRWIDTMKECLSLEKKYGCQAIKDNGAG